MTVEEVEGVEAEVHGAARRVEQADFARVFERAMRDVDGLPQQFFLREILRSASLPAVLSGADSPAFRKISVGRRTR